MTFPTYVIRLTPILKTNQMPQLLPQLAGSDWISQEVTMFANPSASWYHGNQPDAQAPCEHCAGVLQHEKWCVTCDPIVQYAYGLVLDPRKLTFRDGLILHSLGVEWA